MNISEWAKLIRRRTPYTKVYPSETRAMIDPTTKPSIVSEAKSEVRTEKSKVTLPYFPVEIMRSDWRLVNQPNANHFLTTNLAT